MKLSLPYEEFLQYVLCQLNNFFPDKEPINIIDFKRLFDLAIDRTSFCFKHIAIKSYNNGNGQVFLEHLHADQYAVFLWFLSNTVWLEAQDDKLANKMFYLNRMLHGLNCMYDAQMPDIFLLIHVSGTVLGKAKYSDFLVVSQGCTVGAQDGKYPKLGKGVALLPHSSIIGDCSIGDRVSVGIGASIYKTDMLSDKIVFINRLTGKMETKSSHRPWGQHLFNVKL